MSKFGEAAWLKILALSRAAPPGGGDFVVTQPYDDKALYDVVAAACKVSPSPPPLFLILSSLSELVDKKLLFVVVRW